jgi:hypothetical protein
MKIEIGQKWISETHPHENLEIYDGEKDLIEISDMEIDYAFDIPFNDLPEKAKIYFWQRTNKEAFDKFIVKKKGNSYDTTYPYAWAGESKKSAITSKIKKYNMKLNQ